MREEEEIKKIGPRIAFYRKQNRLTQKMLAEKANISKSYLGKIESTHAKTTLSLGILYKLAWTLQIEPYCLLRPIQEDYLKLDR
jgi:Helix-turn-helix.